MDTRLDPKDPVSLTDIQSVASALVRKSSFKSIKMCLFGLTENPTRNIQV